MNQALAWLVGGSFLMSKTFKISLNRLQQDREILLAWRSVTFNGFLVFNHLGTWSLFSPRFLTGLLCLCFCVWAGTSRIKMFWVFPCLHPWDRRLLHPYQCCQRSPVPRGGCAIALPKRHKIPIPGRNLFKLMCGSQI